MPRKTKIMKLDNETKETIVRLYLYGAKDYAIASALEKKFKAKGKTTKVSRINVRNWLNTKEFKDILEQEQESHYKHIDTLKFDIERELKALAIMLKNKVESNPKLYIPFIKALEILAKIKGLFSEQPTMIQDNRQVNIIIDSAAYELIKDDPEKLKQLRQKLIEMKEKRKLNK